MVSVTVDTTPISVLNRNSGRKSVTLRNVSTGGQSIRFWLQDEKGLTLTNADYALLPNEEKTFLEYFDGRDMKNPIAAISDAAGGTLLIGETAEYSGK